MSGSSASEKDLDVDMVAQAAGHRDAVRVDDVGCFSDLVSHASQFDISNDRVVAT
jgi:hypothetical protein